MLKLFGHMERMGEERLVKRVYRANVDSNRGRGTPQRRRRDEGKVLLIGGGLSEREGMVLARDKETWGRIGNRSVYMGGFSLLASTFVRSIHLP